MPLRTPFAPDRYEYEPTHLYYIPAQLFRDLEEPRQLFIIGSRGTGKTTLLQALYWEERISNASLRAALGGPPFGSRYLGVYLKVPTVLAVGFSRWCAALPEDVAALLFALLLDLAWLDSLLLGVSELSRSKVIPAQPNHEHELVASLIDEHPELSSYVSGEGPHSLAGLARAIKRMRRHFERYVNAGRDPNNLLDLMPVSQVGSFGRAFAAKLAAHCDRVSAPGGKWYFKICMDETECLTTPQRRVVNTMVRLASWPLFYVISFVDTIGDFSTTVLPNITLQRADRHVLRLDHTTDNAFRALTEGVATVRVRDFLRNDSVTVDLNKIMGRLNINKLLTRILASSEDPKAKRLLDKAKSLKECNAFSTDDLPIYQAFLIDRLHLRLAEETEPTWKRRSQQSREIRKRMVAAYLAICRNLGAEVRYAGAEMLLQMSDKCIRDFLAQMNTVYLEAGKEATNFIATEVPIIKQDKGLKTASNAKVDNLTTSGITAPSEVFRIVDGLGRITARIQSEALGTSALKSSERGVFVVEASLAVRASVASFEMVREAAEAGYLRLLSGDDTREKFRVHCSLAAAFGFSYRGAYYETPLSVSELESLRTAADRGSLDERIDSIVHRIVGLERGSTLSLFEEEVK
jgi:hypothetical protein